MRALRAKFSLSALYGKEGKAIHGYVKAIVRESLPDGPLTRYRAHPYFHVFFVPFSVRRKRYALERAQAITAKDVTPEYAGKCMREWKFHPLYVPEWQKELADVLFGRIEGTLEQLVARSVLLDSFRQKQMRTFMGSYPLPLREQLRGTIYGTPGDGLEQYIRARELPSYLRESSLTPQQKKEIQRVIVPPRAWNPHG